MKFLVNFLLSIQRFLSTVIELSDCFNCFRLCCVALHLLFAVFDSLLTDKFLIFNIRVTELLVTCHFFSLNSWLKCIPNKY